MELTWRHDFSRAAVVARAVRSGFLPHRGAPGWPAEWVEWLNAPIDAAPEPGEMRITGVDGRGGLTLGLELTLREAGRPHKRQNSDNQ